MSTRLALLLALALALLVGAAWLLLRSPRGSAPAGASLAGTPAGEERAPVRPAAPLRSRLGTEPDRAVAAEDAGSVGPGQATSPPPSTTLRVLDILSGADLRAVTVLAGVPAYRGRLTPGSWSRDDAVVVDGTSPLELPPREGVVEYWVGARGFGWQSLQVDHDLGGQREVRLHPAGAVEVLIQGPREGLALAVRLYAGHGAVDPPDGRPLTLAQAEPDPDGRALLEGLPPGDYEVRAEVGMWYDPPHVLARERLDLLAGDRARVVLHLQHPLLEAAPAPLAGELVLPAGHAELDVALRIFPASGAPLRASDRVHLSRDGMEESPRTAGVLRFDAGTLTPGLYVAIVDPLQAVELVELPAGGLRDLRLVLPSLQLVQVEVVDAATGEPLRLERIAWSVPAPDALTTWSYQNVEPGPEPGRFSWLAPPGAIRVIARAPGYREKTLGLRVEPGGVSARMELAPLFGARITLLDGAAIVPASWSHSGLELRRAGEERELERGPEYGLEMGEDARWRVLVSEPGRYVLTLPELPGFLQPAPIEIPLAPGPVRELEVPLVRAP